MKIVLAYSGGLDTSVILSWLKEKYDAEIIAFCANIGQEEELKGLEAKAKRTGASKCYIADLQEEFARDFIFPMIQAGAVYESQYFLGTSIARPLIAKGMIEIAKKEKAAGHRPRRHRQRQRPGPLRADRRLPRARTAGHRPLARRPVPRPVPRPRRDDRLLRGEENPRPGLGQEALFDGPQPPAHLLRGRHPGRPLDGRLRAEEQGHVQAQRRPRGRAGQSRIRHARFQARATASPSTARR